MWPETSANPKCGQDPPNRLRQVADVRRGVFFTLMKTQDWVETSVLLDNDICPTISASGVSLSIIMPVPSHAEFVQILIILLLHVWLKFLCTLYIYTKYNTIINR